MGSNITGELGQAIRGINVDPALRGLGRIGKGLENFSNTQGTIGEAVDVAPLTEAAQSEAARAFQNMMGTTNEQFGGLNLGSSSARQAELGRQASGLSQAVGETGLRAGVSAQEAAKGRQVGLRGQDLTGLLGAGDLGLGAGRLGLDTQLGRVGAGQDMMDSIQRASNQAANRAQQQRQLPPQAPPPGFGGGGGGGGGAPIRRGGIAPGIGASGSRPAPTSGGRRTTGGGGFSRRMFARGGSVPRVDEQDFLSNLLFGVNFNKPPPPQFFLPAPVPASRRREGPSEADLDRQRFLARQGGGFRPTGGGFSAQRTPGLDELRAKFLLSADQRLAGMAGAAPGSLTAQNAFFAAQPGITLANLSGGPGGSSAIQDPNPDPSAVIQQFIQQLQQSGAQQSQSGGFVEGPAVPPDQVPILAQGGEGVIPVNLMSKLEKSNSKDPLIKSLKTLMFEDSEKAKNKKKGCGGAVKKQSGGKVEPEKMQTGGIPTGQGNQNLRQIQQLLEQIGGGVNFPSSGATASLGAGGEPSFELTGTPEPVTESAIQPSETEKALHEARRRLTLLQAASTERRGTGERLAPDVEAAQGTVDSLTDQLVNEQAQEEATKRAQIQAAGQVAAFGGPKPGAQDDFSEFRGFLSSVSGNPEMAGASTEEVISAAAALAQKSGFSIPPELEERLTTERIQAAQADLESKGMPATAAGLDQFIASNPNIGEQDEATTAVFNQALTTALASEIKQLIDNGVSPGGALAQIRLNFPSLFDAAQRVQ